MPKVLVACEESQAVTKAFRDLGIECYSCDIQEPSGGYPQWHIKNDAILTMNSNTVKTMDNAEHFIDKWDLLIAHPPCTYLSNAGARHLYPHGVLNKERLTKGLRAKDFFMQFYNSEIAKIAIENPIPSLVYQLPTYSQIIQPYYFGEPYKKKTCLWLRNLPPLRPTNMLNAEECESTKITGNWFNKGGRERQKNRAKTFQGIAKAMSEQWGNLL